MVGTVRGDAYARTSECGIWRPAWVGGNGCTRLWDATVAAVLVAGYWSGTTKLKRDGRSMLDGCPKQAKSMSV